MAVLPVPIAASALLPKNRLFVPDVGPRISPARVALLKNLTSRTVFAGMMAHQ
jgi:hypothetical protein